MVFVAVKNSLINYYCVLNNIKISTVPNGYDQYYVFNCTLYVGFGKQCYHYFNLIIFF